MAHSIEGSITIIVACIAISLLVLFTVHRFWMPSKRLGHNDAIGPNVSVMGTTYAVIIAFVLSGVWNELQAAMLNTEQEANSVVNLYRFAEQLPPDSRAEIQKLTRDYAIVMPTEEWPAMERETSSDTAHAITKRLWRAVTRVQPRTVSEQQLMDHSISELTTMTEHRRIRLLESRQHLPAILWQF